MEKESSMAKITNQSRDYFEKKIEPYKKLINEISEKEKEIIKDMENDNTNVAYKKISLVDDMLHIVTLYLVINDISIQILSIKKIDSLNEARKILYKAIIYLEETVTSKVDVVYSEYEENVQKISNISVDDRYYLVRKVGLAIHLVIDAYGDNTKWKWSFVELEGRFATVAKNLLDLKIACKVYFDPGHTDYKTTAFYFQLIERLLDKTANSYRDRYELYTHSFDDIRLAINYVLALRRIQIMLGNIDEAEESKKKAASWSTKMGADQKKGVSK